jgi:hypothetical protein
MKYFNYNDTPATHQEGELPRILVNGEWVRFYDLGKFDLTAMEISKPEFDRLVAQQQATGQE